MRPTRETVGGRWPRRRALVLAILAAILTGPGWPMVADAQSLDQQVLEALRMLYETTPASRALAATAKGILVFPDTVRDNYVFEGSLQSRYGALLREGKIVGYYSTSSITYGFQAGVLSFGYALFLMTDAAPGRLEQSDGWQVGRDPRVVIVSRGTTKAPEGAMDVQSGTMEATSDTMGAPAPVPPDTYAFVFGQTDLLTGVGIQGWKIVKYKR
jgi:lipid-binding SYLF domain-containing protein